MFIERKSFERYIKNFQFRELFNELGWDHVKKEHQVSVDNRMFKLDAVAEKRDFVIFTCKPQDGERFLDKSSRKKIDQVITKHFFEHLIIYIDNAKEKQVWQLSIKEPNRPIVVRETEYYIHQTPELLFQKLKGLFFTLEQEEKIGLVDVKQRVTESFNTNAEKVTKQFYDGFKKEHTAFLEFIEGIDNLVDKEWYASLMLNRLMFIYFIQKKGFLDNNTNYLQDKLKETQTKKGENQFFSFYKDFLLVLFHKGLGRPDHDSELIKEIGRVPYLNGGLFDEHQIEKSYQNLNIDDKAFECIFEFFDQYNWHLDTRYTATGRDINPDVIGYIFEKYINDRAAMGAYYTKEDITDYISKNTIVPFLFDEVKKACKNAFQDDSSLWNMLRDNPDKYIYEAVRKGTDKELPEEIDRGINKVKERTEWNKYAPSDYALPTEIWREVVERRNRYFEYKQKIENNEIKEINDFITYNLDIKQFAQDAVDQYEGSDFINAFYKAISKITVLDPTCGSGAFLFAALNILEPLYETCIYRMKTYIEEDDQKGGKKFSQFRKVLGDIENHPNLKYYIYKSIILNNLYGVDIMNEAVEIAKLRLFLKLVATVDVDYNKDNLGLEPLPDIDFNIRAGNTLVGFATKKDLDDVLSRELDLYNKKDRIYENIELVALAFVRFKETQLESNFKNYDSFKKSKIELYDRLSQLNEELNKSLAKLKYGVDAETPKYKQWKSLHRPFHWFAEFYEIIQEKGGFDVVIGNPPYLSINKIFYSFDNYNLSLGDLYGYVIVRVLLLLKQYGNFGFIVMHSIAFSKYFSDIRNHLTKENANIWFSFFARIPSGLFSGDVRVRNCIFIINRADRNKSIIQRYTTRIHRWFSVQRESLFARISYVKFDFKDVIPMFNDQQEAVFYENLKGELIEMKFSKYSNHNIYFKQNAYNWIAVTLDPAPCYNESGKKIRQTQVAKLSINDETNRKILMLLFNGRLFFSYWLVYSDEFHVTKDILGSFRLPFSEIIKSNLKDINILYEEFISRLPETIQYKSNAGKKVGTFNTSKLWDITDKSDKIFIRHVADNPDNLFESIQNHVNKTIMTQKN